jgi:hypothetical protein
MLVSYLDSILCDTALASDLTEPADMRSHKRFQSRRGKIAQRFMALHPSRAFLAPLSLTCVLSMYKVDGLTSILLTQPEAQHRLFARNR